MSKRERKVKQKTNNRLPKRGPVLIEQKKKKKKNTPLNGGSAC